MPEAKMCKKVRLPVCGGVQDIWTNLSSFVLCDFVLSVLLAFLPLAISPPCLGNVNLKGNLD